LYLYLEDNFITLYIASEPQVIINIMLSMFAGNGIKILVLLFTSLDTQVHS